MINSLQAVRVFAPATCANVAVGYDILGFAIADLGDELILTRRDAPGLSLSIGGQTPDLPINLDGNTASQALISLMQHLNLQQGFHLQLNKGIPVSAGLGGSAASAVAAVVALNAFLENPLTQAELLEFALDGEAVASGSRHADNVLPCLYGGFQLINPGNPSLSLALPDMPLYAALVHPHWAVNTREARAVLSPYIALTEVVQQTANLAGFMAALYEKNYQTLAHWGQDVMIEAKRAHLIPYFYEVKAAGLANGGLICSLSGSGSTVFALAESPEAARHAGLAMRMAWRQREIEADLFLSPVGAAGACVLEQRLK